MSLGFITKRGGGEKRRSRKLCRLLEPAPLVVGRMGDEQMTGGVTQTLVSVERDGIRTANSLGRGLTSFSEGKRELIARGCPIHCDRMWTSKYSLSVQAPLYLTPCSLIPSLRHSYNQSSHVIDPKRFPLSFQPYQKESAISLVVPFVCAYIWRLVTAELVV